MGLAHPVACKVQERYATPHFRVGTASMQGYRMTMEDSHRICTSLGEKRPNWGFVGVFDGHGGATASKYCAQTIHELIIQTEGNFEQDQTLQNVLITADSRFLVDDNQTRVHGTTCVFALIDFSDEKDGYKIIVSNTGDSRCLSGPLNDGEDAPTFYRVTEDHKPTDLVELTRITRAGGVVSNGRVDGDLSVSRAVGDWQFKMDPELSLGEQKVSPVPDVTRYTLNKGDWMLLACDGIFERLTTIEVANFIKKDLKANGNDPAITARNLCDYSLDAGSKDNMTVALAVFMDGTDYAPEPGKAEWIPCQLYPNDVSFMNAYRAFAIESGFESLVSDIPAVPEEQNVSPIMNLIAQMAADSHEDEGEEDSEEETH